MLSKFEMGVNVYVTYRPTACLVAGSYDPASSREGSLKNQDETKNRLGVLKRKRRRVTAVIMRYVLQQPAKPGEATAAKADCEDLTSHKSMAAGDGQSQQAHA
jgi:hypothetical protein